MKVKEVPDPHPGKKGGVKVDHTTSQRGVTVGVIKGVTIYRNSRQTTYYLKRKRNEQEAEKLKKDSEKVTYVEQVANQVKRYSDFLEYLFRHIEEERTFMVDGALQALEFYAEMTQEVTSILNFNEFLECTRLTLEELLNLLEGLTFTNIVALHEANKVISQMTIFAQQFLNFEIEGPIQNSDNQTSEHQEVTKCQGGIYNQQRSIPLNAHDRVSIPLTASVRRKRVRNPGIFIGQGNNKAMKVDNLWLSDGSGPKSRLKDPGGAQSEDPVRWETEAPVGK